MRVTNKLYVKPELKKFFAENGLLPGIVADKVGVTRQTIHKVYKSSTCTPPVAKKICDEFNLYMWDYFMIPDEESVNGKKN